MENLYLCHHGIKGQKWGIRRFQNEDGTLTTEGRKRLNRVRSFIGLAGSKRRRKVIDAYKESFRDNDYISPAIGVALSIAGTVAIGSIGAKILRKKSKSLVAEILSKKVPLYLGLSVGSTLAFNGVRAIKAHSELKKEKNQTNKKLRE